MLPYNQSVYDLLYPRVDPSLLQGYYGGMFNDAQDQFYAATYVDKLPEDDHELKHLKQRFNGYAIVGEPLPDVPAQEGWISLPPEPWEKRDYSAYSIFFNGALYKGEWYVLPSLTFFGKIDEAEAKARTARKDVFKEETYQVAGDIKWSAGNVEMQEFADAPWLVAHVLQKRKQRVNWAFRNYLAESVLDQLAIRLRIHYPEKYDIMYGLFGSPHFTAIFPEHKRFVLLGTAAKGKHEETAILRYLVYQTDTKEVFEWTYFSHQPKVYGHFSDLVAGQLKTVSYWNHENYIYSSCTLDDDRFWEQYVFAKENSEYRYLRKLEF